MLFTVLRRKEKLKVIEGSSYRESTVLTIQKVSISKFDSDPKSCQVTDKRAPHALIVSRDRFLTYLVNKSHL